jgi:hypothetical protein
VFTELYKTYTEGRAERDPSNNGYKGDLRFFVFYAIPFANKLKDYGFFGASGFEYLDYAERNRAECEAKGQKTIEEMMNRMNAPRNSDLGVFAWN